MTVRAREQVAEGLQTQAVELARAGRHADAVLVVSEALSAGGLGAASFEVDRLHGGR